jgi:anti-sigma-K factor RskA
VALTAPQVAAPAGVKDRVMKQIQSEAGRVVPMMRAAPRGGRSNWLPWAIAAGLAVSSGVLLIDRAKLRRELLAKRASPSGFVLVPLKASPDGPAEAQGVVAWDAAQQTGTIKIANLPAAGSGRDYQLWAVDAAYADPISAGIVRVDPSGVAQVQFKPGAPAQQVKAFALSIEREGGVPKREGPILLIGTT